MEKESKNKSLRKSDKQKKFDKMKNFSRINKGKLFIKYDCFFIYIKKESCMRTNVCLNLLNRA